MSFINLYGESHGNFIGDIIAVKEVLYSYTDFIRGVVDTPVLRRLRQSHYSQLLTHFLNPHVLMHVILKSELESGLFVCPVIGIGIKYLRNRASLVLTLYFVGIEKHCALEYCPTNRS